MPVEIVKPENLKELWKILPQLPTQRVYLAGGTDLIVRENCGLEKSSCWIDISDIKDLRGIKESKTSVMIGAGVKIAELEKSAIVKKWLPVLHAAIPHFASPSLRNLATLGGNAANASPCADAVCALCAERANIILNLKGKVRTLALIKFLKGMKKTVLRKDELIAGFEIPKWKHAGAYLKLGPRSYFGISKVAVAVALQLDSGFVGKASIALGSVAPMTLAVVKTSKYLENRKLDAETLLTASEIVQSEVSPITDTRSEADYRRAMSGVLLGRALAKIKGEFE